MVGRGSALGGVLLVLGLMGCDCGSREGEPVEPASVLRVESSGTETDEADRRWGEPGADIEPLAEMPPLREVENPPGAALHPAQMLELPQPVDGAALEAAYAKTYEALGGMNGWFPLAETVDGWKDFVIESSIAPRTTRRIACATDMAAAARIDDVVSVPDLVRGCRLLQAELGGTLGPEPDAAAIEARTAALYEATERYATLTLHFEKPEGLSRAAVHEVARALGMMRSDFGTYAFYNAQDQGHDRLIVLDPGVHPDAPGGADATTPSATLRVNLSLVPAPALVAERMWQAAKAMAAHLAVEPTWLEGGEPVTEAAFEAEVRRRLEGLRAAGMEPDAVVAG